ncbi:MAG: hypothetical protein C0501_11000 [Isosphaera sp.]|nr:hypothetical protein [Isosphaera sp.]
MLARPARGPLAALLVLCAGPAPAAIIQSGFNDVTGINADGVANNSPFNVNNAPLMNQGAGEPGWAGPWQQGGGVVVGRTAFEGDGAAAFFQNTATALRVVAQDLLDPFSVSVRFMVPGAVTDSLIFRVADSRFADIFGIAVQWFVNSNLQLGVLDGVEDSCISGCPVELTGMRITPGVWHEVRVEVDPVVRTWNIFLDGVMYNAPDPLGFRSVPAGGLRLNQVSFVSLIANPNGSFLDAVVINNQLNAVPEPASGALAAVGVLGLAARRLRRR